MDGEKDLCIYIELIENSLHFVYWSTTIIKRAYEPEGRSPIPIELIALLES
jgi:hypothetical protein